MNAGKEIEVSVVLPCLNEKETIATCIKKIKEIFLREGIAGEVIVVDNLSADGSGAIAASLGAKVISESRRGYGSTYLRGLREAQGEIIIIGDSDNTYDFYDIPRFLKPLKEGYDFVIGSRFKGKMHKGAMPWLNRYLGNPVLSAMSRIFFRINLSDIHCGMRAFTKAAYRKMRLRTMGMEFATEMVFSASQNKLKMCEVPIHYYPRMGKSKLKPFPDAWRHIRFMLLYCPLWLYFVPGAVGFISGLLILLVLLRGPFLFLGRYWDIHVVVFGSVICILSYQIINLGIYAHTYAIKQGFLKYDKLTFLFQRHFSLERGIILGAILFLSGLLINILILIEWFSRDLGALYRIRESILAMTFLVIGLQTVFSSFFISLLFLKKK
ncbi:MAG: glycosyltransferase family 2 protein [Candidatus Omnitrophica bacterium]|nr:glycosyltransferase family 2 protein [Candidatus Omnitrophota bacterium]